MLKRFKTPLIALVGLSFIATGCTTLDPYTQQPKRSNAAQKAAVGAVIWKLLLAEEE